MSSTKVTFVTGTAEVKRRDVSQPFVPHPEQRPTTEPHTPQQVSFVDGKCTCCPYGYHIDLDFLNFCRDMESGATLRNLKRIQKAKRKLRKSMEIMLDEQEGIPTQDFNSLPPDIVHSTEAGRLMHMVNYERSATHRILNQIDSSVNTTLGRLDGGGRAEGGAGGGGVGRGQRYMSSDSDDTNSPLTPMRVNFPQDDSRVTPPSFTSGRTDSLSSLSSVSTVSSESPMLAQAHLYQQQQFHQLQRTLKHRTTTQLIENPVIEMGTAEMKPVDEIDRPMQSPVMAPPAQAPPTPPPRASPDINQMSLQSVREAMAVSLTRLKELEEQVKAIPILQVRISVLKEEKRLLNLQLKASKAQAKPDVPTVSVGVGNHSVIEPYLIQPELPTGYTIRENVSHTEFFSSLEMSKVTNFSTPALNMSFRTPVSFDDRRPASTTPFSPENSSPRFTINQIQRSTPKALTRSIGVGDSNVFDSSGLQIHEKETRTVIIGQGSGVAKRNVGIECRVPTRDVGVSFMCDEEKPQTRTIGVNVNYDTSELVTSFDFKGETELRMALKGVLQRNVHTKATNCNFKTPTEEKSVSTDFSNVSVGCGDDTHRTDVEIRAPVVRKTIGMMAKPEMAIKFVSTEKNWMMDAGTNTIIAEKYNKAIMTERTRQGYAATNTDPVVTRPASNQTDQKVFYTTNQIKHTGSNTQKPTTYSSGTSPDIMLTRTIGVNTTESVKSLFEESETRTEINPYTIVYPARYGQSNQEKIIEKGTTQASAFLTQSDSSKIDTTSQDLIQKTTVDTTHLSSSSRDSSTQRTSENVAMKAKSPEEDSFSETITEHYVITKDGKKLVSQEKDKTVRSGGRTSNTKSTVYGPGARHHSPSRGGEYISSESGFSSSTGNRLSSSSVVSGSSSHESQDSLHSPHQWAMSGSLGSSTSSHQGSGTTGESRFSTRKGGRRYSDENGRMTSGTDTSSYSSQLSPRSSRYAPQGSRIQDHTVTGSSAHSSSVHSSSSSSGTSSSSTVVTNPYKTVENLAAASLLFENNKDSQDGRKKGAGFKEVSKTASEGNLFQESSSSSYKPQMSHVKSMDTIYDIRRVGSVEDFMPDDVRKYMSIDPSNSKDSGFGEDLQQKFTEESSSSSSARGKGGDKEGGMKSVRMSRTVTTRRTTKKGNEVSVEETKTVESPDGKSTTVVTKSGGEANSLAGEMDQSSSPEQKTASESMVSSSSSSSSFMSSGYIGGGSDSNLSSSFTSSVSSHSLGDRMGARESTRSSRNAEELEQGQEAGNYGSLDRKTGLLKSIMKQKSSEKEVSGKKGISFAESVTGGTGSSNEDNSSESDDSDASFEEGSYHSEQGQVIFQCQDDQAIAEGQPGAQMFDQNIRETYELSAELKEACNVVANYLMDSTTTQTKELNASTNLIQQEWFQVSSHKLSNCHQVEDYLSSVNEISRRLLQYIINMVDSNGNTAIHYCISHCNFDIASLLMDSEVCDINKRNKAGYTPVMLAGLASAQNLHQREIVRRIFSMGDINARAASTDQTALMLAASHGRAEMVKLLVEAGADYNISDVDGSTALMCACEHGHLEIVSFLLSQPNINAEAMDNEGSTALTIAMEAGHKDVGVVLYKHLNFSKTTFSATSTVSQKKKKTTSRESSHHSTLNFR